MFAGIILWLLTFPTSYWTSVFVFVLIGSLQSICNKYTMTTKLNNTEFIANESYSFNFILQCSDTRDAIECLQKFRPNLESEISFILDSNSQMHLSSYVLSPIGLYIFKFDLQNILTNRNIRCLDKINSQSNDYWVFAGVESCVREAQELNRRTTTGLSKQSDTNTILFWLVILVLFSFGYVLHSKCKSAEQRINKIEVLIEKKRKSIAIEGNFYKSSGTETILSVGKSQITLQEPNLKKRRSQKSNARREKNEA